MRERGHTVIFIFGSEPHPVILEALNAADSKYFVYDNPVGINGFCSFLYELGKIIRGHNVDVIQGQFHPHSHYAVLAGFITGKPSFVTIHSTTNQSGQSVRLSSIIKNKISAFLSKGFFAVSRAVRKDLIDNLHISPGHISVLHNGIDLHRYNPRKADFSLHRELGIGEDSKIFLTIAQARPEKGLEYLVRAVPGVVRLYSSTHFVFCGGGPLQDDLIELAKSEGVSDKVHFLGVRNDVPALLNDSYASVLPSLAEPLGNAVLEAMAMKKAVVATGVDGIPEMVEHGITGLLVPPGDPHALASSIVELIKNPEVTHAMGAQGRKRVESEFELNKRVLREIRIYEDFLAGKANP